jgi:hypothetical protein
MFVQAPEETQIQFNIVIISTYLYFGGQSYRVDHPDKSQHPSWEAYQLFARQDPALLQ